MFISSKKYFYNNYHDVDCLSWNRFSIGWSGKDFRPAKILGNRKRNYVAGKRLESSTEWIALPSTISYVQLIKMENCCLRWNGGMEPMRVLCMQHRLTYSMRKWPKRQNRMQDKLDHVVLYFSIPSIPTCWDKIMIFLQKIYSMAFFFIHYASLDKGCCRQISRVVKFIFQNHKYAERTYTTIIMQLLTCRGERGWKYGYVLKRPS